MSDAEKNPRAEVIEETSETLDVLRLDRTPRAIKLAREAALFTGAAEVQLSERSVTLEDTIDTVRKRVDALQPAKRALPEARPPPPAPVLAPEPEPEAPQAKLTAAERAAVERLVPGRLVRVDTIYATMAGQAVEATYEHEGKTRRRAYLVREGAAADLDELGRVLDQIPTPTVEEEVEDEPEPEAPRSTEVPVTEPAPRAAPTVTPPVAEEEPATPKRRFAFGKKKDDPPAAGEPAKEAAEPASTEAAPKKRFAFGRKKNAGDASDEAAEPPAEADAEAAPLAEDVPKKRRFGLGRK